MEFLKINTTFPVHTILSRKKNVKGENKRKGWNITFYLGREFFFSNLGVNAGFISWVQSGFVNLYF